MNNITDDQFLTVMEETARTLRVMGDTIHELKKRIEELEKARVIIPSAISGNK